MRLAAVKGRPVEELLRDRSAAHPRLDAPERVSLQLPRETRRDGESGLGRLGGARRVAGPAEEVIPISIEQGLAKDLRIGLGDELEWDVQGVPVRTRVAGLREVEWCAVCRPTFSCTFRRACWMPSRSFTCRRRGGGEVAQRRRAASGH